MGGSEIDHTECLVLDCVTTYGDLVPDDWTSCAASKVINRERLTCGKRPSGVVKAAVHIATTCARC